MSTPAMRGPEPVAVVGCGGLQPKWQGKPLLGSFGTPARAALGVSPAQGRLIACRPPWRSSAFYINRWGEVALKATFPVSASSVAVLPGGLRHFASTGGARWL